MELGDLPSLDYDDATGRSPVDFLAQCRRETPLIRLISDNPEKNVLLVTAPADVRAVIADADIFSSTGHPQAKRFDSDYDPATSCIYARHGLDLKNIIVWSDGAYHARVRKLIDKAFSAPRVAAKIPYIQHYIDQLIDGFAEGGRIDFVQAFSWRLPSMVVTREFGLQPHDVDLVLDVTNKVSAMMDILGPANATRDAAPIIIRLHEMLLERLALPGSVPEDSLLADLSTAKLVDTPALSRNELLWLMTILLAAGSHTTGAMLAWSLYVLATMPDLQARLRREPGKIDLFVEELLRVHGPVPSTYRTATADTSIGGVAVPRGTSIMVRWDSINLDAEKWPDPETFDIDRPNLRFHSTFGLGKHFCIGNVLARRELAMTVETMLARFSSIGLAADVSEIQPIKSFDVHLLGALPLRLTRAPRRRFSRASQS